MTVHAAVAPRLARLVAAGAMAYTVVWALVEIGMSRFQVGALVGLALLCGAFALARTGSRCGPVRSWTAAGTAVLGVAVEVLAHPHALGTPQIWVTCAAACVSLLLLWRDRHLVAWAVMGLTAVVVCLDGGVQQLQDLGVLTIALVLGVIAAAGRVLGWYAEQMRQYADSERDSIEWRVAQDAYQQAHQQRIEQTGRLASPMLQRIVADGGLLAPADRAECRLLHQSIRDETRGRRLLNDAVREQVRLHRRRGAVVQVLDDGRLAEAHPDALAGVLDELAGQLTGLGSDRIVIRSSADAGRHVITVVATSVDPVAAALGQDDEEQVDLYRQLEVGAGLALR